MSRRRRHRFRICGYGGSARLHFRSAEKFGFLDFVAQAVLPKTLPLSLPSYFATSARTVQMGIGCAEWAQSPADKLSEVKYAVRNDTTAIANLICSKDNSSPCARSKTASSRSSSALSCSAGLKNAALRSLPFNLHRARCADSQWANLLAALDFSFYRQSHSCLQSGC